MSIQTDVLVIGSGAAGAVALARAKERGLNAIGVSKSIGASGYSSGAVDFYDLAPEALKLFQKLTASIGYVLTGYAVSQAGLVKQCLATQASQAYELAAGGLLGVVELSGLTCFRAAPVAHMLKSQGYEAVPITAHLGHWNTFLEFAKDFEDPELLDSCMDAIVQAIEARSVDLKHVFVPAIFGLSPPMLFLRSLQMRAGVSFSELLGLSHSIPGLRLGNLLSQGFKAGSVARFEYKAQRITQVILDHGEVIEPKSVILATGRFLSGGFGSQELLFGLPLVGEQRFKIGLACDEHQRPLGAFGELFASNLFAAGSSLGGYDPAEDGGMARAIATGYRAGDLC